MRSNLVTMKVRLYVDGFNLYYGGRRLAGDAHPHSRPWKWLDLRALGQAIADHRWAGMDPEIDHVTYCTARIIGRGQDSVRQQAYLQALRLSGSADHIEYGLFRERLRSLPRASSGPSGTPLVDQPMNFVNVSIREEKGSDVNVATHLVFDALSGTADAAIVISNDSDLSLALKKARTRIPVGIVSPHGRVHGSLKPAPGKGTGHWYHSLSHADLADHQLDRQIRHIHCPEKWARAQGA